MPNPNLTTGLAALRALEAAATEPQWQHGISGREGIVSFAGDDVVYVGNFTGKDDEDLACALRNSAPQMIAAIEAAAEVQAALDSVNRHDLPSEEIDDAMLRWKIAVAKQHAALDALAAVLPKL